MHNVNHRKNIIEVKGVSFSYHGNEVLHDIHLSVHRGDYLALVGGNGSGKTTLIKMILGLLSPSSGNVMLFGQAVEKFHAWSKIGYVSQRSANFDANFPATVEDVVLMGRYGRVGLFRRLQKQDRLKAEAALRHVELWEQRKQLIGELSGGQLQRAFIARSLATEPEVVILDEPTVGVEKNIRDEFYALLKKLNRQLHLTVMLVTHDIESMAHEAMHIACMDQTLYFHESVDQYFHKTHQTPHPHA